MEFDLYGEQHLYHAVVLGDAEEFVIVVNWDNQSNCGFRFAWDGTKYHLVDTIGRGTGELVDLVIKTVRKNFSYNEDTKELEITIEDAFVEFEPLPDCPECGASGMGAECGPDDDGSGRCPRCGTL